MEEEQFTMEMKNVDGGFKQKVMEVTLKKLSHMFLCLRSWIDLCFT
jgi:hypothetical protein